MPDTQTDTHTHKQTAVKIKPLHDFVEVLKIDMSALFLINDLI